MFINILLIFSQLLEASRIAALCQLVYVSIDTIDTNYKLKVLAINCKYVVTSKKVPKNAKQDQY
jgi:hypothetical protein